MDKNSHNLTAEPHVNFCPAKRKPSLTATAVHVPSVSRSQQLPSSGFLPLRAALCLLACITAFFTLTPLGALADQLDSNTNNANPGATVNASQSEPDYYSKLVTLPSNVYGVVRKDGPLPLERYDDTLFNHTIFREWLLRSVVLRENVPGPAPMSYKCGVFVNHHYKLIFIRNRKAASTTVLDAFKVACRQQSKLLCMRPFNASELPALGLTPDEMWRRYFVVSSTRNPWARAASGFDYTQDRWPVRTGVCGQVPFRRFCSDPYLMGKLANLFRCGPTGSFRGSDAWAYDFYHVEPAHHCMTTGDGRGLAVDFLVRYEHLHNDVATLLALLNRRRDPQLPEIHIGRMRWMKQGVSVRAHSGEEAAALWQADAAARVSADRHAGRYRECGRVCVEDIAAFFETDLELMKLEAPGGLPER